MPKTGTLKVNLSGTYDPEGDRLNCWISTSYGLEFPQQSESNFVCDEVIEYTFPLTTTIENPAPPSDTFSLTVNVDDGVNPPVTLNYDTILYNEIPEPIFTIIRT